MKKLFLFGALAAGAFIIWQWWISRRNGTLYDLEAQRRVVDKQGQAQENLGLANRPRMASDERLWALPAIVTGVNQLWSQLLGSGRVNNSPEKVATAPDYNPMIFGYGQN